MRVVLDTNVFVSGIFWEGNFCSQIIEKWRKGKFEMVSSLEIIEELVETLKCFKIKIDKEIIDGWRNLVIENSVIVETSESLDFIKDDPDDNKFIEAAIVGKADFIVSQDKHLLELGNYQSIKIISPKEAISIL